jgi:enoyl-CoA hydratase/carnithine racemase
MVPLVRSIPAKVAMEMLLTARPISAARAYEIGLVNKVVASDQLDGAVEELTEAIRACSPEVIALGKRAFYEQYHLPESAAYDEATGVMVRNTQLADFQEGVSAFLAKRAPQWTGG